MKPATLLNIVLAIALVVVCAKWAMSDGKTSQSGSADSTAVASSSDNGSTDFEEFDVTTDFHGNPFTYFKGKGLLLAVGDEADHNEMTIGWGALGNIWEKGMSLMTVYVAPGRHTFKYMEKAKYFTVMEFDDAHKDILEYEMIYHAPFDPKGFGEMPKKQYADFPAGIHSMYMGKIVKAMRKK